MSNHVEVSGTRTSLLGSPRAKSALEAVPVLILVVLIASLVSVQGGYFPSSWGWATLGLVLAVEAWLVLSGRTDAGTLEVLLIAAFTAFFGWLVLSTAWSTNPAGTIMEAQRTLMLVVGCAAFIVLVRRKNVAFTHACLVVMITLVCGYGLATRLFPTHLGVFDPVAEYRLSAPIGYWNGLGLFAGMGIVLALGLVTRRDAGFLSRGVSSFALVVLSVTMLYTFSRGALLATGLGLALFVALSEDRLWLAGTALVLAPVPLTGVIFASQPDALTHRYASLAKASDEGRRIALLLIVLALVEVAAATTMVAAHRRVRLPPVVRRAFASALVVVVVVVAVAGLARLGSPVRWTGGAYDSFLEPATKDDRVELTQRLASLSGNGRGDLWGVAWRSYRLHPVTGTGAGTYERSWQRYPGASFRVKDAHSLYLETLSELGPVGLGLLAVALSIPLAGALGARKHPLAPALIGTYSVFLVHVATDWDWELSGITMTALLVGTLALATRRVDDVRPVGFGLRVVGTAVVVCAGVAAFVGLLGSTALASAENARDESRFGDARSHAITARQLMPWSPAPLIVQGEAEYESGEVEAARASFDHAIALDERNWRAWLALAVLSDGQERANALARARRLYPASAEIEEVADELRRAAG